MKYNKKLFPVLASALILSACGGGGGGNDSSDGTASSSALNAGAGAPSGGQGDCSVATSGVNWDALMTEICPNLSDYNLFADATDPTSGPMKGGLSYDLSTPLFSDYTSKYRFVFIPEGAKATYDQSEVLKFPVGTVIAKTFALPENTAFRDGAELVIETRLLIHRNDGWIAIPYYWSSESDATLAISGKTLTDVTTSHNGVDVTFSYSVPAASDCTSCHAVVPLLDGPDDKREQIFLPIGPKARYLNWDYTYEDGTVYNQLQFWTENGLLEGLPVDMQTVERAPRFTDTTNISALSGAGLHDTAKAYLDINCAHCHRSELTLPDKYAGAAGGSGLQVEYNRAYEENPGKFGTCKTPVAGGHPDYPRDVVPGAPDDSYLYFRITTNDNRHRMPELARNVVHQEGAQLIRSWIDQLPRASCSPGT
ncbi:SO2930 family diheme c-type cytochrome [Marinobacter mobilis]|uniref:Cytochrome c domain-containing protein n=1 Tax=Marinobacter mobilis TaxID=488533 RepID=A0A1H2S8T0_9GAMM|nr:SO2930 family diheme c-type cytochrome [Marinobacter mobilis]SDW27945.1 conserved hypothetical protein, HNE_0200 family [Marinobacter mobilis]